VKTRIIREIVVRLPTKITASIFAVYKRRRNGTPLPIEMLPEMAVMPSSPSVIAHVVV